MKQGDKKQGGSIDHGVGAYFLQPSLVNSVHHAMDPAGDHQSRPPASPNLAAASGSQGKIGVDGCSNRLQQHRYGQIHIHPEKEVDVD